ncbi:MAG: hypothetical protein SVK08_01405 [Halobacteriota archaeon]|nr:hypothetical protein [Halobacteriota archaeon]
MIDIQKEAWDTHLFDLGNELPICLACGMTPISAHIWGDVEWTKNPIKCPVEQPSDD